MAIDKLIEEGKLIVERISGVDYIRLSTGMSAETK